MARAAAVILENNSLALIKRNRNGQIYYLFPGGQIEDGESQIETVSREVYEELGLEVKVGVPVAEVIFEGKSQFHYLAEITGGEFRTGKGTEMLGQVPNEYGTYAPVWVPLVNVLGLDVRPRVVAEMILNSLTHGWPEKQAIYQEGN